MPATLIIAGDGQLRTQVRATIKRLGLTEDVQMLGKVSLEDIRSLYDSASVLLFTSLRESFGAPFIEALGRGLPAVALDLAGIADADVGDAALKVALPPRPGDLPRRLASALQTILCDHEWESRSDGGRQVGSRVGLACEGGHRHADIPGDRGTSALTAIRSRDVTGAPCAWFQAGC